MPQGAKTCVYSATITQMVKTANFKTRAKKKKTKQDTCLQQQKFAKGAMVVEKLMVKALLSPRGGAYLILDLPEVKAY